MQAVSAEVIVDLQSVFLLPLEVVKFEGFIDAVAQFLDRFAAHILFTI